jgi:hypothetical protein
MLRVEEADWRLLLVCLFWETARLHVARINSVAMSNLCIWLSFSAFREDWKPFIKPAFTIYDAQDGDGSPIMRFCAGALNNLTQVAAPQKTTEPGRKCISVVGVNKKLRRLSTVAYHDIDEGRCD